MIAVDDGCPDSSGRVALEILAERAPDAPARVIFLADAIREGSLVTAGLESTDDSRKGGARNKRGKRFIALWKRMLPLLGNISDTQCGFKAWRADVACEILSDLIEHPFAFDVELLIKTELRRPGSIARLPIAWIDSEAASTTPEFDPYLGMLKGIAAMYRQYLPSEPGAEEVAGLVERAVGAEEVFG